jgi:iron complex outermembrane receptor protein
MQTMAGTTKTSVTLLALAIGCALQAHAGAALAQETDTQETVAQETAPQDTAPQDTAPALAEAQPSQATTLDTVTVTGIRGSMRTSVSLKKNTMEIMDSITAEDIGKLPDPNVAETLTRIPGVQGYRYGGEGASPVGEGSGLTIRGLSGQTASRVDERAYFTAGGREFNIEGAIPGMIAGVDVYKNPSAEHIEGGIGGLINIRTRKPLDFDGLTISSAVAARYNDMVEEVSPEIFGLIANKWQTGAGEMGFLFAANYQETYNRSDSDPAATRGPVTRRAVRADSAEYTTLPGADQSYAGRSDIWHLADADYATVPESERGALITALGQQKNVFQETIHRVRKGASAAFQWKPSDDLEFYAEGNYNYYLYDQDYRFLFPNDSRTVQDLVLSPYAFDENFLNRNLNGGAVELVSGQRIDSATSLGSTINGIGGNERRPYETWLAAAGANWQVNDRLHANLDLSYIKADQTQDNRSVDFNSRAGLTWDLARGLTRTPHQLGISGPSLSDPANFVLRQYNNGSYQVWDDDGYAAALSFKFDVGEGFLRDIKFGTRYAVQNANYNNYSFSGRPLTTDGLPLAPDQSNGISLADNLRLTELAPNNWLDGEAGYSGGYVVFNPSMLGLDNMRSLFPLAGIPDERPENLLAQRSSKEESLAGYIVGDFAVGEIIKGNVGVRVVKTDLSSSSMVQSFIQDEDGNTVPGPIIPEHASTSYTNYLPSFNITGYLTKDTLLRFGYAKAITRPALASLNPAITVNTATGTGSGGNPELSPLKADSFDLSLEQYFSPVSYVSIGVFYKDIKGFPFGLPQCMNVPFAPNPGTTPCEDPSQYEVTIQANAEDGSAKGVELSGQTFFTFLPGFWSNFGVAGSYTYLKTKNPVNFNGNIVDTPMPFQSKYSYSATALYEDDFVSGRLVYTYRDDFILFGIDPWPSWGRYVEGYGILDASLSFNLNENVSLSLNASNLLNEAPNRYAGEPGGHASDFSIQHFMNGRNFGISLRATFD